MHLCAYRNHGHDDDRKWTTTLTLAYTEIQTHLRNIDSRRGSLFDAVLALHHAPIVDDIYRDLNSGSDNADGNHDDLGAQAVMVAAASAVNTYLNSQGRIARAVVLRAAHETRDGRHHPKPKVSKLRIIRQMLMYSRKSNVAFTRITTVKLDPRVVHRMITDRERVNGRPQPPPRPPPDVRVHLARHDERDEVAYLRGNHSPAAPVRPVANVREHENDHTGQARADGRERVRCDGVEPECPAVRNTLLATHLMIDGVYVVSGLQVENTANVEMRLGQRL